MADNSNTARPRPRPRPRPIAKASNGADISATPGSSSSGTSSMTIPLLNSNTRQQRAPIVIDVKDNDEMFMRNQNRSSRAWQKLEKINKDTSKVDNGDGSSESDTGSTPRKGSYKRAKKDTSAVPAWQKQKNIARLLSHELSDDSDDGIEITGESSTPNGKGKGKRKRARSRSRSITPPPALPAHQIQNAKNVVRQTLQGIVRPASPTTFEIDDDSSDNIDLQPEFMLLAQKARDNAHRGSSQAPEGVGDEIVITVKWYPHPLDSTGKREDWQYKIDRGDNFQDLFEAVAEDASIPVANLILTYEGKRFFSSVTPQTLKIWTDSAELSAYAKTTYEYMQKNVSKPVSSQPSTSNTFGGTVNGPIDIESDSDGENDAPSPSAYTQTQTQESDAESEVEGDKFKLILRSSGNKDITLTVRSTTKCGAIIKAFLKKLGLEDQYPEMFGGAAAEPAPKKGKGGRKGKANAAAPGSGKDPRLCIDGDRMDNGMEIGEQDLEDGDMVEVVGL